MRNYCVVIRSSDEAKAAECIAALRAKHESCPVVVVWGGKAYTPIKERLDPVRLPPRVCVLPGADWNVGIREVPFDLDVVLMDDDVLLRTDRGLGYLALQWMDYAALSPLVDGSTNVTTQYLGRVADEILNVEHLPIECVYLRRPALGKVGLPGEPGGFEDWCRRARAAGYICGVYRGVVVEKKGARA